MASEMAARHSLLPMSGLKGMPARTRPHGSTPPTAGYDIGDVGDVDTPAPAAAEPATPSGEDESIGLSACWPASARLP